MIHKKIGLVIVMSTELVMIYHQKNEQDERT